MKTSHLGILVVGSTVGWITVACASDTDSLASTGARTPATNAATGGASLEGAAGAATTGGQAETGGTGAVGISSGVDPEKPLNELTQTEVDQLCLAIASPALEVATDPVALRATCVLRIIQTQFAHTLTTLEQCQEAMAGCNAAAMPTGSTTADAPLPSVLAAGMACVSTTPNVNPTCRASVGELEGCMTAGLGTLSVANRQTCATILSGAAARHVAQSLGNAGVLDCQGYQRKCPDGFVAGN